jgi:hypothetical protein
MLAVGVYGHIPVWYGVLPHDLSIKLAAITEVFILDLQR